MPYRDAAGERHAVIESRLDLLEDEKRDASIARLKRLRFRILEGGFIATLVAGGLFKPRSEDQKFLDDKASDATSHHWDDRSVRSYIGANLKPGLYNWKELTNACADINRRMHARCIKRGKKVFF